MGNYPALAFPQKPSLHPRILQERGKPNNSDPKAVFKPLSQPQLLTQQQLQLQLQQLQMAQQEKSDISQQIEVLQKQLQQKPLQQPCLVNQQLRVQLRQRQIAQQTAILKLQLSILQMKAQKKREGGSMKPFKARRASAA